LVYEGEIIISIIISLIMISTGFTIAILSDKIKPGPLFGFRISYATVSRKVWVRTNRIAGIAIGVVGAISLPFGILWGLGIQSVVMTISLIAAIAIVTELSKRFAEVEMFSEPAELAKLPEKALEIKPLSLSQKWLILSFLLLSLFSSVWSSLRLLNEGLQTLSAFMLALWSAPAYLGYLSLRRPEAYSLPWIKPGDDKLLALSAPICLSLISIGISLMMTRFELLGLYTTLVSIASLTIIAALILIRSSLRRSKG